MRFQGLAVLKNTTQAVLKNTTQIVSIFQHKIESKYWNLLVHQCSVETSGLCWIFSITRTLGMDVSPALCTIHKQVDKEFPDDIHFKLPRVGALSGTVLQHCSEVFERFYHSEYPMTFKVGFTHNALWRWGNPLYGYITDRQKWFRMVVVYVSDECYSASMLEAALIDKYKSASSLD